ncbi:unnamed protein product [Chrysodeixis includens]|uniref:Uncharacterized protein n=1 Tax=Chrysodeixis includens TaxID=689277 RepID=A0A9N8PY63_CHRIL|nr:unnamed protein product [Chrysodeixis includens]CAH0578103.1 unnamed protein product [Chrysodeixis includens]
MAYSLGDRFAPPPKYFTLLDPGAYQNDRSVFKQNVAPFLSNAPRNTNPGKTIWTQAEYKQHDSHKIPNCTAMLSKKPRFPYEPFSAEDLEEMLCKCGIVSSCECLTENEQEKEVICQGKVRRRIYKGPTPRSVLGDEGLSAPSRNDHGFSILTDGTQKRKRTELKEECPPFYDARVNEATAFYRGCKWSRWTSKRSQDPPKGRPGPGHYNIEREPTKEEICGEEVRAYKRKTTRQLRFIEIIQMKNILDDLPGPAHYSPKSPKGTDLKFTGTRAKRFFSSKYDITPGPQAYFIKRDFEVDPSTYLCHATLPERAAFGCKASRFKHQSEEGPSPVSYDVNCRICKFSHCPTAPFGTSARRFSKDIIEEDDEQIILQDEHNKDDGKGICVMPTWGFQSKTIRMKPLVKKNDEPSPADIPQDVMHPDVVPRCSELQIIAPFHSSEGRFQPWFNWIPHPTTATTPGPAQYCLDGIKCTPAVVCGPLSRAERFPPIKCKAPAPNKYMINDRGETILATHNKRLKNNISSKHTFHWKQPPQKRLVSYEERACQLLAKSISLLDTEEEKEVKKQKSEETVSKPEKAEKDKPKMLRTFLYARPLPNSF